MLPTLSYWCFSPGQTMAQLALMKARPALWLLRALPTWNRIAFTPWAPYSQRMSIAQGLPVM